MTRTDIEIKLKPFTESITDGSISTLSAIRNHLSLLVEVRKLGVSIPLILEISGCSYSPSTFSDKLSKLKKQAQQSSLSVTTTKTQKKDITSNNIDYNDWIKAFDFKDTFHTNALKLIVPALEKGGWNSDNYHLLRTKYEIMTLNQLINIVGTMKSSQFRRIVYKDGQAVF
jgi:hypothetical protein